MTERGPHPIEKDAGHGDILGVLGRQLCIGAQPTGNRQQQWGVSVHSLRATGSGRAPGIISQDAATHMPGHS
jgi:hypothetical protein